MWGWADTTKGEAFGKRLGDRSSKGRDSGYKLQYYLRMKLPLGTWPFESQFAVDA